MESKSVHEPEANVMSAKDVWDDAQQIAELLKQNLLQKEIPPNLHNQIVEFLTSLPNIQDKNERRALIYSAGLDKELENQLEFDGPTAQCFQLLVHTLVRYGKQEDGRDPLIALLETAKNKVGQDGKAVCDRFIQFLRKGVQGDREQGVVEEESKIDVHLKKIQEVDEVTGVETDTRPEGSTKVTIRHSCSSTTMPEEPRLRRFDNDGNHDKAHIRFHRLHRRTHARFHGP